MKKVQKKLYARLKKAKAKAIKNKGKVFYVYKYSTRDIKCITNDGCRLATKLDIRDKRLVFHKRSASDNKGYYLVDEELKIEKLNLRNYAQLSYDELKSESIIKNNPNKFIDEDKIRKDSNHSYVLGWFINWKEGYTKGYISPFEGFKGYVLKSV